MGYPDPNKTYIPDSITLTSVKAAMARFDKMRAEIEESKEKAFSELRSRGYEIFPDPRPGREAWVVDDRLYNQIRKLKHDAQPCA